MFFSFEVAILISSLVGIWSPSWTVSCCGSESRTVLSKFIGRLYSCWKCWRNASAFSSDVEQYEPSGFFICFIAEAVVFESPNFNAFNESLTLCHVVTSVAETITKLKIKRSQRSRLFLVESKPVLIKDGKTIECLLNLLKTLSTNEVSKRFIEKLSKGNINGAIKLLSDNFQNSLLPLGDQTLKLLKQKNTWRKKPTK